MGEGPEARYVIRQLQGTLNDDVRHGLLLGNREGSDFAWGFCLPSALGAPPPGGVVDGPALGTILLLVARHDPAPSALERRGELLQPFEADFSSEEFLNGLEVVGHVGDHKEVATRLEGLGQARHHVRLK